MRAAHFPSSSARTFTHRGEEEEEEHPSKKIISRRKTGYKKHFQKQHTLDVWHPLGDGFVHARSPSVKYSVQKRRKNSHSHGAPHCCTSDVTPICYPEELRGATSSQEITLRFGRPVTQTLQTCSWLPSGSV